LALEGLIVGENSDPPPPIPVSVQLDG
jgi:hypothetical protein